MTFKNISLRIKLTFITTIIMIVISVVLTVVSVFNANVGFSRIMARTDNLTYDSSYGSEDMAEDKVINDGNGEIGVKNPYDWGSSLISPFNNRGDVGKIPTEGVTETVKAVDMFKATAIVYMVIIIIIGSIFIYLILGKILKPVKELSSQVGIINENKLSQRVSGVNSGDEIGELAHSFNTMLDRLDKAFESQKRFSSDAAHELKTPLTALKTNLDILSIDEEPSDDDYKRTVAIFRKQTERMISLVNNLFILSAQKEYEFNDIVNLDIMIEEIIGDLEGEIKDKNISISLSKNNISIQGNYTMITHALGNIIQNAIKYNNEYGNVFISTEEDNGRCIIRVRDNGIGISEDKVEHIFDAFYRVDQSRSRKIAGAGLGLAITKDIVNRHGGEIRYFPNEEGGSIFEITLPLIN
ncbi:HAMP domain-containing histidine kinase [Clostridium sp. NSJ-6]|uniref:histidine kinase n=1 Tax=Clostridium hominis TaxID=2763036 RepID=A0ABR7DFQ9_9CLOT|nr:HAMP domain-containing sensor histidine kinase [Clostridium hominis]MBC5629673.1 HAMP domain-containing histidine kinase [Clostridium hominis]